MTRIAIDAMGGDHAPFEIVAGAVWGAAEYGVGLELVGKQDQIEQVLDQIDQEGIYSDCGKGGKKRRIRVDVKKLDIKILTHQKLSKWEKLQDKLFERKRNHLSF